ncbi:MAG: dehydrogenase, partial [Nocardioides sp.]
MIVEVSLAGSDRDCDEQVSFLHRDVRLVRVGTEGDARAAEALVREWSPQADAIAVTGIREARAAGLYDGDLEAVERVMRATTQVPVTDGHGLRDVLQEWAIRHVQ